MVGQPTRALVQWRTAPGHPVATETVSQAATPACASTPLPAWASLWGLSSLWREKGAMPVCLLAPARYLSELARPQTTAQSCAPSMRLDGSHGAAGRGPGPRPYLSAASGLAAVAADALEGVSNFAQVILGLLLVLAPPATKSSCSLARTRRLAAGHRRLHSPLRPATARSPPRRLVTKTQPTTMTATAKTASSASAKEWTQAGDQDAPTIPSLDTHPLGSPTLVVMVMDALIAPPLDAPPPWPPLPVVKVVEAELVPRRRRGLATVTRLRREGIGKCPPTAPWTMKGAIRRKTGPRGAAFPPTVLHDIKATSPPVPMVLSRMLVVVLMIVAGMIMTMLMAAAGAATTAFPPSPRPPAPSRPLPIQGTGQRTRGDGGARGARSAQAWG